MGEIVVTIPEAPREEGSKGAKGSGMMELRNSSRWIGLTGQGENEE